MEKARCSNRLMAHLKVYFPQELLWVEEIGSNIVVESLDRWPTLEEVQRAQSPKVFAPPLMAYAKLAFNGATALL